MQTNPATHPSRLIRLTQTYARNRSSTVSRTHNHHLHQHQRPERSPLGHVRAFSGGRVVAGAGLGGIENGGFNSLGLKKGDKVVIAISGGVDSSLSLALLASPHLPQSHLIPPYLPSLLPFPLPHSSPSGTSSSSHLPSPPPNPSQSPLIPYKDLDISAIYMRNWKPLESEPEERGSEGIDCAWEKDWEDVQVVCRLFGVDVRLIDLSQEYWLDVFEPSITAWETGQTPNPDVACNRHVKFGELARRVLGPEGGSGEGKGKGWLATGHYAATDRTSMGRTRLLRSADRVKDQTYYLSSCSESQLSRALFPLANLQKSTDVRALAKAFRLPTAEREESMGVCFIGERRGTFGTFVSQYTTPDDRQGHLVTSTGTILGTHQGLWHYTIGQRARLPGMKEKWFVASKDVERNRVVVVPGADHPALSCTSLQTPSSEFNWVWPDHPPTAIDEPSGFPARCQVRHRMGDVPVVVRRFDDTIHVQFDEQEKGVAPGQVVGLWDESGKWCLGSGVIAKTTCLK